MTDELIGFETAVLAKDVGFYGYCNDFYFNQNDSWRESWGEDKENHNQFKDCISRPTQSLLQRWLREKHNIDIYPNMIHNAKGDKEYVCFYYFSDMLRGYLVDNKGKRLRFPFYELALEAGLKEACKYIKNKQNKN